MRCLIRNLKLSLYSKNGHKKFGLIIFLISILIFITIKDKISEKNLLELASSDMFNISGVLAGFIFTGLGMIITSTSKMIEDIKATDNFCVVKNYYSGTIIFFLITIILYLFKICVIGLNIGEVWIKLYLYLIIVSFVAGILFFIISLKILNAIIND